MSAPNEVPATQTDDDPPLTVYLEGADYSSMLEHLGGPVVKLTKRGYQNLEDAEAESALFEEMYEQLDGLGIQRPLYLCVDCTELDGLSRAARKQMAKESKESGAYFASIACYGLGPFVSSVIHLFRLLRWQIGIHLFHDEEHSLAFLLDQMATAENDDKAFTGIFDQREHLPVEEVASTKAPSAPLGGPTLTGDAIRFLNQHLPQAETIRIGGFEQRVMQPPSWVYVSPGNSFRFQAVLVGDDTVLSTIRGNLQEADVEALQEHWREIFAALPGIHFHLIHDCLGLHSISLAARRKMLAWDNRFEVEVRFQVVVGDETTEMLLSWGRSLAPELLSAMTLKSSSDEAFEALRLFRSMRPGAASRIPKTLEAEEVTTIELAGETVEVFAPEHWQLSTEDGQTRTKASLLGHNTILAECSGKRTAEHTREIIALLDSIVLELGSERLHIIQLDHDISGVDSEVRRLRIAHFRATRDTWLSVCHIGTPGTRTVLTLLEPIISAIGHQVHAAASLTEAWGKIRQISAGLDDKQPRADDLDSLDPAELPLVLKSQQQRLREYDEAGQVLLEGMTRLTFADDDAWQPNSLSPDGPFAPLFSALHLLERDFREIMTERDRRENQLAMAQIEAEAANTVKTQFLATMSHELRTPLTPIFGLIERLQGTNLDSEQLRAVDGIERAATGLLHQVSDLLDFATIGAGKLSLNPKPCDLRMLILATIELHSEAARAKSLQITLAGEEKLPPLILVDPGRFQQVLDNLVSNAIKFTETGGVDIRVTCEEFTEEIPRIRLRVDVSDTGPGVPTEEARTIFSRFNRGQAAEESVLPGVGLGLAIANNLIRHMGGMIGLETDDSVGATFWFELSLPILELDEATASADSAPTVPPDGPSSPLNGARVLVVEDNDDIRELTSSSLQDAGCRTILARNGSEALDVLTNESVDLILMDCKMPVMDGYETTEELRRLDGERSNTPVVALTAYALGEERERCFASGMDDYLTKPFSRIQLLEVVARNLPEERM